MQYKDGILYNSFDGATIYECDTDKEVDDLLDAIGCTLTSHRKQIIRYFKEAYPPLQLAVAPPSVFITNSAKLVLGHNPADAKLINEAELTFEGRRLDELSDKFYTHFNSGGSVGTVTEWPRPRFEKEDNAFSEFLASHKNSSREIRDFATTWGFPYDSTYPYSEEHGKIRNPAIPPKRVSFIVDYSGSMAWTDARTTTRSNEAIDKVLKIYDDNHLISDRDYVSFTLFDDEYTEVFPFQLKGPTSRASIDDSRESKGGTAFYDAVIEGLNKFGASLTTKVQGGDWMIILTDGEDCGSTSTESDCIASLKASDANVFIIGFMLTPGSKAKISLDNIYTTVNSNRLSVLNADNDQALADVFAKIGEAIHKVL